MNDELTGSEHSPLVLEVFVSINISHNPADMIMSSTSKTVYTNAQGAGQFIQMSFELECSEDYYGSDCGAYCAPRDDNFGHFSCDRNGNIVCLSGFSNTATNCTECILSQGCCKLLCLALNLISIFTVSSLCMAYCVYVYSHKGFLGKVTHRMSIDYTIQPTVYRHIEF